MKITLEIDNQVLVDCLNNAHSRYWGKTDSLIVTASKDGTNIAGFVTESEGENGRPKKHRIDVSAGLLLLVKYSPELFARVISGDSDGPDADVFLQLCAGLTYTPEGGPTGPKYG